MVVRHIMLLSGLCVGSVEVQSLVLRRIQKLPEDGRLLPKHVGASILNKAVVQVCVHRVGFFYCV
jgi:hypothetical protein